MPLRDITIYAEDSLVERYRDGFVQRFHGETCCVVELVLALLKNKAKTGNIAKIALMFSETKEEHAEAVKLLNLMNVLELRWPFDFEDYVQADPDTKKRRLAQALQEALLYLCKTQAWDSDPFVKTFEEAAKKNFIFEGYSKASWVSPSQCFRARIFFRFELECVELFAAIFKNRTSKELVRKHLGRAVPEMGCLDDLLKDAHWESDSILKVRSSDFRQKVWKVDLSELITS